MKENIATVEPVPVNETGIIISPDNRRVILRPHIPYNESRVDRIISRIMALDDGNVGDELKIILDGFSQRHRNLEHIIERQYELIRRFMPTDVSPSKERRLLIGSYFLSEYSYESAALFNPSMVLHPDQSGLSEGSLRFILSLRATGEGHVSSLAFRSGTIDPDFNISIDEVSGFASTAEMKVNVLYDKSCFSRKLREMCIFSELSKKIIGSLSDEFTFNDLVKRIEIYVLDHKPISETERFESEKMLWLARCNYEAHFDLSLSLSEKVLFPLSPSEQNGIEDARFVLFTDDDGSKKYYATYTAYDGRSVLPQMIETEDFQNLKMITLNGNAVLNKGMALFPRKIGGRYAMISRQDNENIFLMYTDNIHFWNESRMLMKPSYPWEFVQIGNCGSPIETAHGWLLITHGVGPFRQYSIGAVLLDREDPSKIIGRLKKPLIRWTEETRAGYVPNVVYSCGALIYNDMLVIPYALSDQKSAISTIPLSSLVGKLINDME